MWRLLVVALLLGGASLRAQTAQITGRVTDPSGSVMPGATVKITETATSQHRAVRTNQEGYYTIPLLKTGVYEMTVEKTGFQPLERSGLSLDVYQVVRLDFALQVGTVTEQ